MNISYNKLLVDKNILINDEFSDIERENILKKTSKNDTVTFDDFNIENYSIIDFLDYIEFNEYDSYVFISNKKSNRLEKIVEFLNSILDNTKVSVKFESNDAEIESINIHDRIHMGNYALITGIYPAINHSNVIKHVVLESNNSKNIPKSVLLHCSWNTVCLNGSDENTPLFINVNKNDYILDIYKEETIEMEISNIKYSFETFKKNATWNVKKFFIQDIGRYFNNSGLHTLVFDELNIYGDLAKRINLSKNGNNIEFTDLLNQWSLREINSSDVYFVYFHHIFGAINRRISDNCTFITPINMYKKNQISLKNDFPNWIGVINNDTDEFYLWNLLKNIGYLMKRNEGINLEILLKDLNPLVYTDNIEILRSELYGN
ncbi:hypothetical protein M2L39_002488 [Staphylococcus pseudintermedius]|uniref:hypothetical protein n=2 Tax=Staphylococcus pseudintermedius TaxID=283734 RepID=UPI001021E82C|nr:hypothetical protein [Staphylococcus pseudintermedius]EGQ3409286.1 hypothetical protein [Staphylococcus pseudintermedius]EGQ3539124.1 hypothetical protein [Staphylococcus pseudintermedius]EGQ3973923.1 hypothetical protein [Staphylococcus pseudintermedius]EIE3775448.1 hypothetical protein [Staphylococcus pseudintermedius]EII6301068.1 hypothetical protein [Staphylococcus pseudintermedius]